MYVYIYICMYVTVCACAFIHACVYVHAPKINIIIFINYYFRLSHPMSSMPAKKTCGNKSLHRPVATDSRQSDQQIHYVLCLNFSLYRSDLIAKINDDVSDIVPMQDVCV